MPYRQPAGALNGVRAHSRDESLGTNAGLVQLFRPNAGALTALVPGADSGSGRFSARFAPDCTRQLAPCPHVGEGRDGERERVSWLSSASSPPSCIVGGGGTSKGE